VKQSCEHELSRSLPPSEWPEIDRTLWQAALRSAEFWRTVGHGRATPRAQTIRWREGMDFGLIGWSATIS
jgi:hypothetical protein